VYALFILEGKNWWTKFLFN